MLETVLLCSLAVLPSVPPADTIVVVPAGIRVVVENPQGSVTVRTWDRNAIRISTGAFARTGVRGLKLATSDGGSVFTIRSPYGSDGTDLELMVPATSPLEISGTPGGDVTIDGTRSRVTVETVEGDVWVRGGEERVSVHTVDGDVHVEGVRGRVAAGSADGEIELIDIAGDVSVGTIDGDVTLSGIESGDVEATTVEGDIRYSGTIREGGRYHLATHDGDVTATIPRGASVTVSVETFDGELRASFPVTLQGDLSRGLRFSLGGGSARMALETFSGEIFLIRPGESVPGGPR
ncbi:MAG: DUF4097 domain-containing protein [Gemmatimonadota bacterium]